MIIDTDILRAEVQSNGLVYIRDLDDASRNPGGVVTFVVKTDRQRKRLLDAWSKSEQTFDALWKASIAAGFSPEFRAY
jgi:hypothetical protein